MDVSQIKLLAHSSNLFLLSHFPVVQYVLSLSMCAYLFLHHQLLPLTMYIEIDMYPRTMSCTVYMYTFV